VLGRDCPLKDFKHEQVSGKKRLHSEALPAQPVEKEKPELKAQSNSDFKSFLGI